MLSLQDDISEKILPSDCITLYVFMVMVTDYDTDSNLELLLYSLA